MRTLPTAVNTNGIGRHLYTAEDVAARLNLHVKTIRRFIREGKLVAKRIGKQYRITRSALDEFAGTSQADDRPGSASHARRIIVSSIVDVDAVGLEEGERITTLVTAGINVGDGAGDAPRVDSVYDPNSGRLRLMITASPVHTCDLVRTIAVLADAPDLADFRSGATASL